MISQVATFIRQLISTPTEWTGPAIEHLGEIIIFGKISKFELDLETKEKLSEVLVSKTNSSTESLPTANTKEAIEVVVKNRSNDFEDSSDSGPHDESGSSVGSESSKSILSTDSDGED